MHEQYRAESPPLFTAGTTIGEGGRYRLRRRIGVGGMAEVYKARDTRLGERIVAIKCLSPAVAAHPYAAKIRQLFVQEAQTLSRINDENVVDVLDFGITDGGTPYMVMEFLRGMDLSVFLKGTARLPIEDAVDVILGVCAGVHACHVAGIIHRDLKPANIFLSRTPKGLQPKVLDFSVAKLPIELDGDPDKTRTDLIVGTPSYMSPEQALGRPATDLSDQYSVGALLYRCLTGRSPRGAWAKPGALRPEIPGELERAILRALDATPANRFTTVHALGQSLLPFTSPAGRSRWQTYYQAPPAPLDGNTTGAMTLDRSAEQPGMNTAATVASRRHDLAVHDRTTRLMAPNSVDPDRGLDQTIVDPVVPLDGELEIVLSPSTVDVVASSRPTSPGTRSTDLSASPPNATGIVISGAGRFSYGAKIVAGFIAAAAVTVALITVGAVHLRSKSGHDHTTLPAVFTVAARQAPAATVTVTPASPEPPRPVEPIGADPSSVAAVPQEPSDARVRPASRERARKISHRHSRPDVSAIRYAPDGLPILH
jgi:serine/threonine-protein kinase